MQHCYDTQFMYDGHNKRWKFYAKIFNCQVQNIAIKLSSVKKCNKNAKWYMWVIWMYYRYNINLKENNKHK